MARRSVLLLLRFGALLLGAFGLFLLSVGFAIRLHLRLLFGIEHAVLVGVILSERLGLGLLVARGLGGGFLFLADDAVLVGVAALGLGGLFRRRFLVG